MPNYNTPEIQPVLEALTAELTPEDRAIWGIREGETDLEHARRCSAQLWADDPRGPTEPLSKLQVEQILAKAIADQDMATIDAQLEMLSQSDWTDAELQQFSMESESAV